MIPKLIHQIWWQGKKNIPKTYPNYCQSWKDKNKNFKFMFWDETKIRKLLELYPHLKNKFNKFPNMIQRVDMAKYIILYHYGGIYVDMDSECLKPIDDILKGQQIILVQLNADRLVRYMASGRTGQVLQNNIMASSKGNPFWLHCLNTLLEEDINKKILEMYARYIFRTTGPELLTKAYLSYPKQKEITIISHKKLDPLTYCDHEYYDCSNKSCVKHYPNAYSMHHYGSKHKTHSWNNNIEKKLGLLYCQKYKLVYLIQYIIVSVLAYYFWKYMLK